MTFLKKNFFIFIQVGFLLFIFFFGQLPLRDYDIWFHIKAGELFVTLGKLPYADLFSHAAQGREWIHFEWLYQIIVYLLSRNFGLAILPIFTSLFIVLAVWSLLGIFTLFNLPAFIRLLLSFAYFATIYEFNTTRPHTVAYSFLIFTIYLIFLRIKKDKKWIFLTPILTLIWTNIHSTGFLSWGFFFTFFLVTFVQWILTKKKVYRRLMRDFGVLSVVNGVMTILPPMGFLNYKLLWIFFTNRDFLGKFIAEWAPTLESDNPVGLYFYIIMGAIATILFLSVVIKRKIFVKNLIYFPFFPLILLGYTATRNVYLGTFGYFVLLGISMSEWGLQTNVFLSKTKKMIIGIIAILWVLFFTQTLREKSQFIQFERRYYPVQSTEFVKRYLKGRMYNDYTYGGYVLYQVYPKLQVLIDGRAEVYLCCEMRDYVSLAINKNLPDREYIEFLKNYFDSYHISFAILPVYKHNVIRRIARHLQYDLHWALVFWDDESQVFVKRDGLNDAVIAQMEAKAATPYSKDPFDKENIERALFEYERIDAISKSARTHNALGYIYLLQGEYVKAKERFLEAINQDPWFESPFMNLAELAVKDGDLDTAIANYQKAKTRAEDRGLIYIRLGQLLLERDGNQAKSEVRKLWEQGIAKTVDEDAKKELEKLLLSLL